MLHNPLSVACKVPSAAQAPGRLAFNGIHPQKLSARHVKDKFFVCRVAAEETTAAEVPTPVEPAKAAATERMKVASLTVGQVFQGTVKSTQPYGCFVDFGAESNGLVHISQLADMYVKDVNEVVQVGQTVSVRVLSVEGDKRVSLSMKAEASRERARRSAGRREDFQQRAGERRERGDWQRRVPRERQAPKHSLKVGDELKATVVRTANFGAFLACEDGFEVLMPVSEMQTDGAISPNPRDYVKEGEEITVTVVKVDGNKVAVTNISAEDRKLMKAFDDGVSSKKERKPVGGSFATILSALDYDSLPSCKPADEQAVESAPEPATAAAPSPVVEEPVVEAAAAPDTVAAAEPAVAEEPVVEEEAVPEPVAEAAAAPETVAAAEPAVAESSVDAGAVERIAALEQELADMTAAPAEAAPVPDAEAAESVPEAPPAAAAAPAPPAAAGGVSAKDVKVLREESGAGMMDCKKALTECNGDMAAAKDWLRKKGLASAGKKAGRVAAEGAIVAYIHAGSRLGILAEVNCETDFVARGDVFKTFALDMAMQVAACPDVTIVAPEDFPADQLAKEKEIELGKEDILKKPENIREKIVQGRLDKICNSVALLSQPYIKDDSKLVSDFLKETISVVGENMNIRRFVRYNLGEGIEKKSADFAAEVAEQMSKKDEPVKPAAPAPAKDEADVPTVAVNAKAVKELREITGCGMMDCKKALAQNNNDLQSAQEWLRKKGLASAGKKASRVASEGAVGTYIHAGSRLGVLIEVNCETDFVSKGDMFKALVKDMAMQVAACPDVQFVSIADVDQAFVDREMAVELQKEDLLTKKEELRAKIAEGRVQKLIAEKCLLNQAFIKEPTKTVEQHVKEAVVALGENIQIRRFTRFGLGEGIEKKSADFAAEVAAATGSA